MNSRTAALLLAGSALLVVFLVPRSGPSGDVVKNEEAPNSGIQEPLPKAVAKGIWGAEWTAGIVPKTDRIDLGKLSEFDAWKRDFVSGNADIDDGVRLARQRKEVLVELIKGNSREAWKQMLDAESQALFPAAMKKYFEKPVSGKADWVEYAVCFSALPVSGYHEVRFHGEEDRAFFGYPVGKLVSAGSVLGIGVHGFVLDGVALLDGEPPRRLGANERFPTGAEVERTDAVSGAEVVTDGEVEERVVPDQAIVYFDGDRVRFFESEGTFGAYSASPTDKDGGGGGGEAGAPGESVTGQTDSLPFSGRQNGSAKGGLSLDYRTLLYVRLAFHDDTTQVVQSEGDAYAMLRAINDHILESSYGRMQILPTVTPVIVLPETESYYATAGPETLKDDAITELQKTENGEYVPSDFGHRVFRYDGGPGAGLFGGLAQVGFNPGNIWLKSNSASILTHEIGHNYKLQHANQWNTEEKAAIGPATDTEYGHKNDVMGNGFEFEKAQFCSFQKQRLGWLKESEYVEVLEGGRHRIHALDNASVDPEKSYAIKIATEGRGNYWVEYRNNYATNAFRNGLLLQAEGVGWSDIISTMPCRIDATWWSKNGLNDTPIPVGMTFSDHEFGVHVTPLERDDDFGWIDVEVNKGAFPGNQPPVASINASTTSPNVGQMVTFTVTASDPDGDELALWWFFDDGDLHASRDPFALSRTTLWASAGVRSVVVAVSDMRGGVTWLKSEVTVGAPSDFSVSGRVTDHGGAGIGGAAVDNGLNRNAPDFRVTLTDSDGYYVLGKVPSGSYDFRCRRDFDELSAMGFVNPVAVGANVTGVDFQARSLQVSALGTSLAENGGTAIFRIERVGGSTGEFADVGVRLLGEAVEGGDYSVTPALVNDTFTLPAGQPFWDLTITGLDDSDTEGGEDIILALKMTDGLSLVDQATTRAVMTIDDDETALPRVTFSALTRKMTEGGAAKGVLTRYGSTASPLAVNLGSVGTAVKGDDWDFAGTGGVMIPAGISTTTVTIESFSDGLLEGMEHVEILLDPGGYVADASSDRMLVYLADGDLPEVSVMDVDPVASEPTLNQGHLRFFRTGDLSGSLSVDYGVRGIALHGSDYQQLAGVLIFPPGVPYADVVISPISDSITEGDELAIVRIAADDSGYRLGDNREGGVDILGTTAIVEPAVSIAATRTGNEPTDEAVIFTVTRAGSTSGALTVNYFIEGGSAIEGVDYTVPSGSTVIADGAGSGTISIDPIGDEIVEADESIIISLVPSDGYLVDALKEDTGMLWDVDLETRWKRVNFGEDWDNSAVSGDYVDFDGDGVINLLEYGFFMDPAVNDRHLLPQPIDSGAFLSINYTERLNAGLTYKAVASETLEADSFSNFRVFLTLISASTEKRVWRARVLRSDASKRYMRVEVRRDE